jgi:DHA2 family multidrug resistance protein
MTNFIQQSGIDGVTARQKAYALLYRVLQQQASLLSYVEVFHIMGILFLAIIPLIVLMKRPQHIRRSRG